MNKPNKPGLPAPGNPSLRIRQKYHGGMVEHTGVGTAVYDAFLTVFMLLVILACVAPIWHVLMASFSNGKEMNGFSGLVFWPRGTGGAFNLQGHSLLFTADRLWTSYGNTLLYVVTATAIGFVINVCGGYVISRNTMLSRPMSVFVMFSMMFTGGLVPTYMVVKTLGMVGTHWSLIIPGCTNGIFLLLMTGAFRAVPESTVEAARIDGAGHLRTLFHIMLPQDMSLGTVVVLNSVIMQWNSWYSASIYVQANRDAWPLQLWLKDFLAQNTSFTYSNVDYNRYLLKYGAICIATVPMLMAFPFFLKYIEKGVILGGIKE